MTGTFAERLKSAMREKRISQERLARLIGKNIRTVGRYCNGKTSPDVELIPKIEKALGMKPGALYPKDGSEDVREATELIARIQRDLARLQMLLLGMDLRDKRRDS